MVADQTHFRQTGEGVAVVAGHDVLVGSAALRGAGDDGRAPRQILRPLRAGDDDGDAAVGFLAAVEQMQRFGDPAGMLVVFQRDRFAVEEGIRIDRGVFAIGDRDPAEILAGRAVDVHVAPRDHGDLRGRGAETVRVGPARVDTR